MKNCQEQIIILHGWGSSAEKWQAVKSLLNQYYENTSRSIKIVVQDLPGFKKETALSRVWNLDDYVNWFKKWVEPRVPHKWGDLGAPPILLGHSFGGRMAIKFAAQNPEKLKALILVSSAGLKKREKINLLKRPFGRWGSMICYAFFYAGMKIFKFIFRLPIFGKIRFIFRKFFYRYILRKTDYINAEKFPFLQETFKNIIAEDLTPYLEKIKVPTLIIWGDKDKMTPVSGAYLMNKKIPNSKLEILEGIGHAPHLQCPELLAKTIQNFITQKKNA